MGRMVTLASVVLDVVGGHLQGTGLSETHPSTIAAFLASYIPSAVRARGQSPKDTAQAMRQLADEIDLLANSLERADISSVVNDMINQNNKERKN